MVGIELARKRSCVTVVDIDQTVYHNTPCRHVWAQSQRACARLEHSVTTLLLCLLFQSMARSPERFSTKYFSAEQGPEGVTKHVHEYCW